MLQTSKFPELIEPKHRELFHDAYYDEMEVGYTSLFKEIEMGKPTETYQHVGAFGKWRKNVEGGKLNVSTMSEGDTAEYTVVRYDDSYIVTHEMMSDDLSGVVGGKGMMGASVINNAPQLLGQGGREVEDYEAASLLTGGFTNTGYDGVSMFNAAHPLADSSQTVSNLATGELSPANLKEALTLGRTETRGESAIRKVARFTKLVVPPSLQWVAAEIIGSMKQAYENSNTENVLPNLEVIVYDRLEDTEDATNNTNWFLKSDNIENLIMGWKERPFFGATQIDGGIDWRCYAVSRFVPAYVNWRGIVGSTGV